ncbi:MAG: glutamate synthase large subunit, partial [Planctomycetota bacterium]
MPQPSPNLLNLEPTDSCGVGMVVSIDGVASKEILQIGLTSLSNVAHRGAIGSDGVTGDGAGISTTIPRQLLSCWLKETGVDNPTELTGVGMLFLPAEPELQSQALRIVTNQIKSFGLIVLGLRDVPVDKSKLGRLAAASCPAIKQIFVSSRTEDPDEFERELFLARRAIELTPRDIKLPGLHIASLSCRTMVYKAMVLSTSLDDFYPDLRDPNFTCSICIFHQRFSTNTQPTWSLCQPFRMLAHNGEINTIRGNRNWMTAREKMFDHPFWQRHRPSGLIQRLFNFNDSDSASLDNALELLTLSGRSLVHAMSMLIPPAWETDPRITRTQRDFYEFHSCFSEPWDGPAAVAMTDGRVAAACLDRNGLRPARYKLTKDNILILGSEVGSDRIAESRVVRKGRLGPGEMIAVDTDSKQLLLNEEIKTRLAEQQPYGRWLQESRIRVELTPTGEVHEFHEMDPVDFRRHQVSAGLTREEIQMGIKNMAVEGREPTFSMGVDTPLAVLSKQPRLLSDYFKQRFAQVTNPPIDPIRENLVMSLGAGLGPERNILAETSHQCRVYNIGNPVLLPGELPQILENAPFRCETMDCTWDRTTGAEGLQSALNELIRRAQLAVECHASILVLSDRQVSRTRVAIPMLMVVGAMHHALCKSGHRMMVSLIAETSEVRDPHQLALLFGYGATAVYPYLGYATIAQLNNDGDIQDDPLDELWNRYRKSLNGGLLKIMSKMGISVLNSYQGAQVFKAIGIGHEVVATCFKYSYSNIGGIGFREIANDCLVRHDAAFATDENELAIFDMGISKPRRAGEHHVINGKVTKAFHQFVREGRAEEYLAFHNEVSPQIPVSLRDLLSIGAEHSGPIPLDEVEPVESIRTRFTTAAMSLGAISPEAHEAIAIAMNEIGGKSNSGEGGEDPARFKSRADGRSANSRIKQVASGRFGVDAEYLSNALEIEIKMAQGAKPGEGGQLPGFKVNELIARLRNTEPGVTLISPPPHHDIYSIEDLAQLIYDLKVVNPLARVCVKLVAKTGVGGIAIGVAKANADAVLISGHEGGTGASPLTSIKHAGIPWELALAETHQSLVASSLRNRVVLRADGGLKTGRDVIHAAILGAEEFNFGTMALIALGCVYVKKCHLNNCPVGIATQDPAYRDKFKGRPENLIRYLNAVADECRKLLAASGFRTMDEIIGRTDLLSVETSLLTEKSKGLNLNSVLNTVAASGHQIPTAAKYAAPPRIVTAFDDLLVDRLPELLSKPGNTIDLQIS